MSIFRSQSLHKMEAYNSDLKWPCLLFNLKDYTVVYHQNFFLRWRDQTPYILKTQKRWKKKKKPKTLFWKDLVSLSSSSCSPSADSAQQRKDSWDDVRPDRAVLLSLSQKKLLSKFFFCVLFCRSCLMTPAFRLVFVSLLLSKLQLIARSLVSERLMLLTAGALTPSEQCWGLGLQPC